MFCPMTPLPTRLFYIDKESEVTSWCFGFGTRVDDGSPQNEHTGIRIQHIDYFNGTIGTNTLFNLQSPPTNNAGTISYFLFLYADRCFLCFRGDRFVKTTSIFFKSPRNWMHSDGWRSSEFSKLNICEGLTYSPSHADKLQLNSQPWISSLLACSSWNASDGAYELNEQLLMVSSSI